MELYWNRIFAQKRNHSFQLVVGFKTENKQDPLYFLAANTNVD